MHVPVNNCCSIAAQGRMSPVPRIPMGWGLKTRYCIRRRWHYPAPWVNLSGVLLLQPPTRCFSCALTDRSTFGEENGRESEFAGSMKRGILGFMGQTLRDLSNQVCMLDGKAYPRRRFNHKCCSRFRLLRTFDPHQ